MPGQQSIFTFSGDAGQKLFFDSLLLIGPTIWTLTAPSGLEVFSGQLQDRDDVQLTESGLYTLLIDGEMDQVGDFRFQMNDISPGIATEIDMGQEVYDSIGFAGAMARYFSTITGYAL